MRPLIAFVFKRCAAFVFNARGSISGRFGFSFGYTDIQRVTIARRTGSEVSGVRSSGNGTSTLPFTLPRIFVCPASTKSLVLLVSDSPKLKL